MLWSFNDIPPSMIPQNYDIIVSNILLGEGRKRLEAGLCFFSIFNISMKYYCQSFGGKML